MGTPDSTLVSEIADQHHLSPALSLELYDDLTSLKIVTPPNVQHLKKMMDFMLSPLIQEKRALLLQSQKKLYQQSRINETTQTYKGREETLSSEFFYRKEKDLLNKVRAGHIPEVKALLNDLLGFVLFNQGGLLESVRVRSIELTTLLVVAEHIRLSPSYFSSLFSQIVGCSFSEYLCRIRIEESKRLLLSTDYTLANIAVAVGLPDQSYFCKAFKRIVGLTPGKFRS